MKHILLMEGPDEKGLIYLVTSVLYKESCNIITQDEFVSPDGHFFMRTEFEFEGKLNSELLLQNLKKSISNPAINFKLREVAKKDIIIFCTKEHHCLSEILVKHYFGELNANVLAVISNHNILKEFADKFELPFHYIDADGISREVHEEKVNTVLDKYNFEYLVLAKYMRILTPDFVEKYVGKLLNIHHSFLPAFIGANPYKQAYERGVKIIGATAHFVTNDLDEGPIIYQNIKEIDHRFDAQALAREGRGVEKLVLTKALQLVLADKVFVYQNRTVIL